MVSKSMSLTCRAQALMLLEAGIPLQRISEITKLSIPTIYIHIAGGFFVVCLPPIGLLNLSALLRKSTSKTLALAPVLLIVK